MIATTRSHQADVLGGSRKANPPHAGGSRILVSAASPIAGDSTNNTPVRIPKLAVRNRAPASERQQEGDMDITPVSDSGRQTISSHSSERTVSPVLERRHSDQSQQSQDSLERLRQKGKENARDNMISSTQVDLGKGKKKKGSVLGFLALKEPSQSAWEEYVDAQKKMAAQKGNRTSVMSGVSSQKLPDHVPRTNSRWDGLPDSTRRSVDSRAKDSRSTRFPSFSSTGRATGSSSSSISNSSGERSPAQRYGSLSSRPQSQAGLIPLSRRNSMASVSSQDRRTSGRAAALPTRHTSLRGKEVATAGPSDQQIHPAFRKRDVTPWDGHSGNAAGPSQTFLHPPSPPQGAVELPASRFSFCELPAAAVERHELEGSPLATPELEAPIVPQELAAQTWSSPEGSPTTPGVEVHELPAEKLVDYRYIQIGDQIVAVDENSTFWNSDTDTDDNAKPSARAGRRNPVNYSRPRGTRSGSLLAQGDFPLEPTIDEADEEETYQSTLRNDKGQTEIFTFEQPPTQAAAQRSPETFSRAATTLPTVPEQTHSAANPVTTSHSLRVPTFLDAPNEDSTGLWPTTSPMATAQRRGSPATDRSNSDAASLAPSTVSAQWTMSPKERLGLGGRLVKSESNEAPWEADDRQKRMSTITESPTGKRQSGSESKRQSGSSQAGQDSGKLKRFSMKLGGKK